jgi:uncharacterized phage protein gp47/JayE
MYESQDEQTILNRMLDSVSNDVDKRPGSIIYDALAPAAAELAQMYIELDINRDLSFADTATGEYLERRAAEYGINREAATKAKRKGLFYNSANAPFDVPIGSRYSLGGVNYIVLEQITTGQFIVEAEQVGTIGNTSFGVMLPIDYVAGLSRAELADVLVPGEDEETDAALRARYMAAINEQPFGGNVADYKRKIEDIPGVGGVKVFPAWQGGGTVKCTIIASDFTVPSSQLVDDVQTIIDPITNSGEGIGLAPIGHSVTIAAVQVVTVNVETTVTLASGVVIGQVEDEIEGVISDYLLSLRQAWKNETQLVVRISQIEARILGVDGIEDVTTTKINTLASNLSLGAEQIPIMGTVTIHVA